MARYADASGSLVIDGSRIVPADPRNRHFRALSALGIDAYVPAAPTSSEVGRERDRRLALGFDYDFGDARGVHNMATTEADMRGWDEVTKIAAASIAVGSPGAQISIKTETGPTQVTAFEWQQVLLAAAAFRQPIWAASFVLQSSDPIPANYADDVHWP